MNDKDYTHKKVWLKSFGDFRDTGMYQTRIEINRRTVAIILNALTHSIQKQKFQMIHAEKRVRMKDYSDLNYPQFISKLCEKSTEFDCTVNLYKSLLDEFKEFDDIANLYNENYAWIRPTRKKKDVVSQLY